jgi:ubiquitin C-terminal hydrolase
MNSCGFSNNQMNNIQNNNQESSRNSMICSNEKNENYSFGRYKKATTTGLRNLGDTSYLNSVLHLLGSIRPFASYFLNPANSIAIYKNKDNSVLSYLISRLYYHLYPFPEKPDREIYQPIFILNYIDNLKIKKNPCDVIKNILMILHNELNAYKNYSRKLTPNYCLKESVLKYESQNFKNSNKSIISDKLNWFEIRRTMCKKCNYKTYNFLSYNYIELDINKCYNTFKNKPLTIYDCLKYKGLSKQQNMKCNNCGENSNVYSASNLFLTPEMIIFTLDRGISGQNNNIIPFSIDVTIDLTNFIESGEGYTKYQLNGIVFLTSKENKFNYVSFCKSPVDQQWYRYEDENIFPTNINEAINMNNKMKIPFILVYKYN